MDKKQAILKMLRGKTIKAIGSPIKRFYRADTFLCEDEGQRREFNPNNMSSLCEYHEIFNPDSKGGY